MVRSYSTTASTVIVIAFFLTLIGLVFTINFYQDTHFSKASPESRELITNNASLENLHKIRIKNFQGQFELKQNNQHWSIATPSRITINHEKLKAFFDLLSDLRIKKILKNDLINRTNYSIENPLAEVELEDKTGELELIQFGLHNSINQTCYILTKSSNQILQIENCHNKILTIGPSDFILQTPFSFTQEKLQKVYLEYRSREKLDLKKGSSLGWIGDRNLLVAQNELKSYLEHIGALKASHIIRQPNKSQEKTIEQAFSSTTALLRITYEDGAQYEYRVSSPLKGLEGYSFPRWTMYLVKKDSDDLYYLMSNQEIRDLNVRVKNAGSGIMKLSY